MGRVKRPARDISGFEQPSIPPAMTLEDQEDQLVSLAVGLAMQRLREGTASNQLISEIIRMGTVKEKLAREKLEKENELLKAKTEAINASRDKGEKYAAAIKAFGIYAGKPGLEIGDIYDDDEDY